MYPLFRHAPSGQGQQSHVARPQSADAHISRIAREKDFLEDMICDVVARVGIYPWEEPDGHRTSDAREIEWWEL
jgi:hypothetical protein